MQKSPKAGKCHVRFLEESDIPELEHIYLAHEGTALPRGYFEEFKACLRDEAVLYFVASVEDRVVGGGGISQYCPRSQATLTFGIVDRAECRRGYGTAIMLARLLFVDPGGGGCQIVLQATQWSADFFSRLGFSWYCEEEDEAGNWFLSGTHMVYSNDERTFRRILAEGEVKLGFEPDRSWTHGLSESI